MGEQEVKSIFDFASKELSGSAFWAWVLYEAFEKKEEKNKAAEALGKALLEKINKEFEPKLEPNVVKGVRTELSIKNEAEPKNNLPKSGKVDIALLGENEKPLVFIENKHFSTPNVDDVIKQVSDYAKMVKGDPIRVIMTWRHDTASQWKALDEKDENGICFLSLEKQVGLIGGVKPKDSPMVQAYDDYISKLKEKRKNRIDELGENFSQMSDDVWKNDDSLYEMMLLLTSDIKEDLRVYTGTSYGRPWVQAAFCEPEHEENNKPKHHKAFFYRLDRDKGGMYLRLNCYTSTKQNKEHIVKLFKDKGFHKNEITKPFSWAPSYVNGKETTLMKTYLVRKNGGKTPETKFNSVKLFQPQLLTFHQKLIKLAEEAIKTL